MYRTLAGLAALTMLAMIGANSTGCGGCSEPPATHKGAELTGCAGHESDQIRCCSYSGSDCSYTLCRDACYGDFREESYGCL